MQNSSLQRGGKEKYKAYCIIIISIFDLLHGGALRNASFFGEGCKQQPREYGTGVWLVTSNWPPRCRHVVLTRHTNAAKKKGWEGTHPVALVAALLVPHVCLSLWKV